MDFAQRVIDIGGSKMGKIEVPSSHMSGISFLLYKTEEILKLSVKEITNPNCLDALNNPTYGGLYDPSLGTSEKSDVCGTCGQNGIYCPGHMGHIRLPVPAYNPVFFPTMVHLLTGTCFKCHRIKVISDQKQVLICQFGALDRGLISLVDEIQEMYSAAASGDSSIDVISKMKHCLDTATKDHGSMNNTTMINVKNVTARRELLCKEVINSIKKRKTCPHCEMPSRPLRTEHKARVFFQKGLSKGVVAKYFMKKKQELHAKQQKKTSQANWEDDEGIEEEVVEMDNEDDELEKLEAAALKAEKQEYLTPSDVRSHLKLVWENDGDLLSKVYGSMDAKFASSSCATDIFFLDVIPVPPSRFRPLSQMGGMSYENPQTANLTRVLKDSIAILDILRDMKHKSSDQVINTGHSEKSSQVSGSTPRSAKSALELLNDAWTTMQTHINCVLDEDLDKLSTDKHPGVKQLLEKKSGLFRMNMMGKRVNYACRSVISPDPYINTNEIGIPLVFATKLTYPEPVTPWNFQELKKAVLNGPNKHPGACFVENEDGSKKAIPPKNYTAREAMAKLLLSRPHGDITMRSKKVHRHLRNGDVLLLNRQPTLHRPSIQAHKARVLPREKTLRLHYANCKAYNADFDGDEMNAHFPQDEISRAEAYTIALTDHQYLVPKDGTPLAGLLQDHMVSGVMLTIRGRFFCRADYQQLVFGAMTDKAGPIKQLPPCILKPQQLWSGKQVLSTVLINIIPANKPLLNLEGKAKIAAKAWNSDNPRPWNGGGTPLVDNNMTESEVVIRQGELLVGVLDKGHYGPTPYGLVHSCYQLYGGALSGCLLTCLAKLFTCFLQLHGFTLGVEDILCKPKADEKRSNLVKMSISSGPEVARRAFNLDDVRDKETLEQRYEEAHFSKDDELKDMDLAMKGKTDEVQNSIAKVIIPEGLLKGFPSNNLQLMVQSGAKGSSVNCMQISCLLGQIELEGRRPALMMSGKGLPSFAQYDMSPRSGGFVAGRFLTGIRPQEYFFHCMAGREGLVDTAVKTSRSGYLQRCIIKHLEGLMVNYDQTVRDSDGSIVQFQYGEDGLDIPKTQFFKQKQVPFLVDNKNAVVTPEEYDAVLSKSNQDTAPELWKKVKQWQDIHGVDAAESGHHKSPFLHFCQRKWEVIKETFSDKEMSKGRSTASKMICRMWQELEGKKKRKYLKLEPRRPDPVLSQVKPASTLGGVSENFEQFIDSYLQDNPDHIVHQGDGAAEDGKISDEDLRRLLYICNIHAQVQPGEAVGLLAAQSIGEPSTQMTLNTFHFAGRGEMNVTLGIPRLREILMIASPNIKTPNMDVPLLATKMASDQAKSLKKKLNKVFLSQVLEDVQITDKITMDTEKFCGRFRNYTIRFNFLPHKNYEEDFFLDPSRILQYMETKFFNQLTTALKKKKAALQKSRLLNTATVRPTRASSTVEGVRNDAQDDISDDDQHDGDTTATKHRDRQREELDYDGEDEEKEAVEDNEEDEESEELMETDSMMGSSGDEASNAEPSSQTLLLASENNNKSKKKKRNKMSDRRLNSVTASVSGAISYKYDAVDELWCEITLQYPLSDRRLDMTSLVESEAKKAIVFEVQGISRCFLAEAKGDDTVPRIKVEGINLQEMYKYGEILDLNKLYTNNIHTIANVYGIEAAARAIIKEIRDVFAAYGIEVDYHHLSLVADYMTFEGSYKAFNRIAITSHPSPFQKMSFETTMNFLKNAALTGAKDDLRSPSSRIIVGRPVMVGTGCFDLLQPLT